MPLNITDGSTTPKPNGVDFLDEYGGHVATLYETGSRPLTAVGGTANVVTATMAVDLTAAGLVDGLCVSITWLAANTGSVTLAINGGAPIPVVDAAGVVLTGGTLDADLTSVLRYTAGEWRIISSLGASGAGVGPYYLAVTASQTWNKPAGYSDDTMVLVEAWGAGGGGGKAARVGGAGAGGGGGGGYARRMIRYADLPASVIITIGAGGAAGATGAAGSIGGNTTFGSLLTAFGGGGGGAATANTAAGSGGSGGELSAGTSGALTVNGVGGRIGGVAGGGDALTINAGGGGGNGNNVAAADAGWSVNGGGGGGGARSSVSGLAGTSKHGGSGGAGAIEPASAGSGQVPGGGGGGQGCNAVTTNTGNAGAGARGECRITIFG